MDKIELSQVTQLMATGLGFMVFYLMKNLVSEVAELRKEIHSLNIKIAEILTQSKVFDVRIKRIEKLIEKDDNF